MLSLIPGIVKLNTALPRGSPPLRLFFLEGPGYPESNGAEMRLASLVTRFCVLHRSDLSSSCRIKGIDPSDLDL